MSGIGGWAGLAPDAPALISGPGRALDLQGLNDRQRRLCGSLFDAGFTRGDRIAIFSRNRAEVIEVAAGALRGGIVPVPIDPSLTQPEVDYCVEDSGARWLFTDRSVELSPGLERIVMFGDAYERLLSENVPAEIGDHTSTRPMHYTSGTTGAPKGVFVPPADEEEAARRSDAFKEIWALAPDDLHVICSPLAHSAPLRFAIRTLEAGGAVLVQERFDAETTLAAIDLFGVTSAFMVPTHLERILRLGPRKVARFDLSTVRLLAHAGAPIADRVKRSVIDLFPDGSVWEFYGSTEGQATRISTEEWLRRPGSVGQPYPGVRIYAMSEDFEPLPPGEVGRIWVLDRTTEEWKYWGDDEKTAAAWREGAFTVGDLGHLDEDGYLYLAGRYDDTIITGGVNVFPVEIEHALAEHPNISDAMVFGAPSEEWGQEVRAWLIAAPGVSIDLDDLKGWAKKRLAGSKIPKRFEVVEELPLTPTGKKKRPRPEPP